MPPRKKSEVHASPLQPFWPNRLISGECCAFDHRRVFILLLMCVSGPAIGVRGFAFPDPARLVPTGPELKFEGGGEEVIGAIQ